ncbi:AAA family ATPase [Motiliproteus sp. SC1-56]|uniref:AAA family ATPase n=1 Tax=Motiliproteus sp. SC1-56 TaxID=2799565 RepID=UPI001A8E345C|nr:AAA family ATPase [Motiliproteus sp. SC1-56]
MDALTDITLAGGSHGSQTASQAKLEGDAGKPHTYDLAPRPQTLADTGLDQAFLTELIAKHLYQSGVSSIRQLAEKSALSGTLVESLLHLLRQEALVEVLGQQADSRQLRFGLTDRGRQAAQVAFAQRGYVGPAPVPLEHYRRVVAGQSIHHSHVTRAGINRAFSGVVVRPEILDQLGPAVISGRSIFIYGPAGTGKTFLSQRLNRLFGDSCLIPYALYVNDQVVQVFDPLIHHRIDSQTAPGEQPWLLAEGEDPRFCRCRRPVVVTGGELTLDMLEVFYDPVTREYRAPLQLKANSGMFIIDDMGRQHASPMQIFNRWIVPLEDKHDYLSLGAGRHFQTPFDQVLVFSSNIDPRELADEAFLRRIGYKIHFDHINADEYRQIWQQVCDERGLTYDASQADYVIDNLHGPRQIPMCPCHPRDLIGIACDRLRYLDQGGELTPALMTWAWETYFVQMNAAVD